MIDPTEEDLVAWISERLFGYREADESKIRSRIVYLLEQDEKSRLFCNELVIRCADGLRALNAKDATSAAV